MFYKSFTVSTKWILTLIMLDIEMYYTPPQSNFYQIDLQDFSYWHGLTIRVENSVDPDQLASEKPADLDLHCFQNRIYLSLT